MLARGKVWEFSRYNYLCLCVCSLSGGQHKGEAELCWQQCSVCQLKVKNTECHILTRFSKTKAGVSTGAVLPYEAMQCSYWGGWCTIRLLLRLSGLIARITRVFVEIFLHHWLAYESTRYVVIFMLWPWQHRSDVHCTNNTIHNHREVQLHNNHVLSRFWTGHMQSACLNHERVKNTLAKRYT